MRWRVVLPFVCLCLCRAAVVCAQQPEPPAQQPEAPAQAAPETTPGHTTLFDRLQAVSDKQETVSKDQLRLIGNVELPIDDQTKIFADQIDLFFDTKKLVAVGNVVFAGTEGRITAEKIEFNVDNNTGTFTDAFGIMSLGPKADRKQFGNQDADVYFFGQTIEKLGPRKYRVTRGGFSTCVQPTPRWQMTSHSVLLNLDDYAFARDTVLRVKGVPLLYLPVIYYPIQNSGRATGFLLPTYGTSTIRGQAISNAFFWAISRSQDATFLHDWFTRAGQGAGAEYRYVTSAQSNGDVKFYRFNQNEASYTSNGTTSTVPAGTSYEVTANVSQNIMRGLRARARVEYFTDLVNQQLYHQNIYQASRNNRTVEAGLTGNFGPLSTSALYQKSELFSTSTDYTVYGSTPRVTASLSPQRLFSAPVYASVNSEYAFLPSQTVTGGRITSDTSFGRLDVTPTVRVPLSRLTFLSVNTSATYHATQYSRSAENSANPDAPYLRTYTSLRSDIVGPVFTRIWDLQSGFAERLKHVIEPAFTFDFTSHISDYTNTPRTGADITDFAVSGNTRITYGLTNRLFYRGRTVNDVKGQTREFVTVGIQQTYYTNPLASQFDSSYQSSLNGRPNDLSPIALTARVSPTNLFDANSRLEYDVSGRGLMTVSSGGTLNLATASANVNYSHTKALTLGGGTDFLYGGTTLRWLEGRANLTYSLNWDILRSYIQSQSIIASYLAQCCGLQVEFQKYNYGQNSGIPFSSDRRFNFGFVLAGLGTFSNFFGAFGGVR